MAIKGKAQLQVSANLAKGTSTRLQAQLNAISKRLVLNIGKINLQNKQLNQSLQQGMKQVAKTSASTTNAVVKQNQKQADSVSKLINRYKAGKISFQEFDKYSRKMMESSKFNNKTLSQQAKLVGALNSANSKYHKQLASQQKTQSEINRLQQDASGKRVTNVKQAHSLALAENQNHNARLLQQQRVANNQQAKAVQTGLKRIEKIKRGITNKGIQSGSQIFDDKAVKQNLTKLNSMMSSFGKTGGASLRQINSQYAKMDSSIKRVTKATRAQTHSFGNMMREGAKSMIIWGKYICNKLKSFSPAYRVICM